MTYNRVDLTDILGEASNDPNIGYYIVNGVYGRHLFEVENKPLSITGMHGRHIVSSRINRRNISVQFTVKADNPANLHKKLDELKEVLSTDGKSVPISFADEPGITYYGITDGISPSYEGTRIFQGTIEITCPDPYKYGPSEWYDLGDETVIDNGGTAYADPVFTFEALKPATFLSVENQAGDYNMIGRPAPISVKPKQREELILDDKMQSMTPWSVASSVDNGPVTGEMITKGGKFVADTWGKAVYPLTWQGPSVVRSIGTQLLDFKMQAEVELLNIGKGTGMIEIYLQDINGNTVMKIGIEDIYAHTEQVQGKFQLDPQTDNVKAHYVTAEQPRAWNNFKGMLQLFRSDGKIRPYFALVDSKGRHSWVHSSFSIPDNSNTPIAKVQIAIRIFGATKSAKMSVNRLRFSRYNYNLPLEKEKLVMRDYMRTTVGWENAEYVDDGPVTGSIKSLDGEFVVDSLGKPGESNEWYGPSMVRPIGKSLGNFRLKAEVRLQNVGNKTGMLEIYLLDKYSNPVVKIGIEDIWKTMDKVQGKMSLNSNQVWREDHYTEAEIPHKWNDFSGLLQVFRANGRIRPYFGLRDADGKLVWASFDTYIKDVHATEITQVQVAFRTLPGTTTADMSIDNLEIYRISTEQEIIDDQTDYIVDVGDTITMDHNTRDILINGQDRSDLKDFGGNYFRLAQGKNVLTVEPKDSFKSSVKFRDRYI